MFLRCMRAALVVKNQLYVHSTALGLEERFALRSLRMAGCMQHLGGGVEPTFEFAPFSASGPDRPT